MTTKHIAGHDDTRPAFEWQGLQLFADEGAAGDTGATGGAGEEGAGDTGNTAGDGTGATGAAGSGAVGGDNPGGGDSGTGGTDGQAEGEGKKDPAEGPPEKYDLTIPEGFTVNEGLMTEFTGVAKELGLTNDQANKLAGMHATAMQDAFKALNEARTAEVVGWGEAAKTALGNHYDATLTHVALGVQAIEKEVPTLREAMDKTGFGNTIEGIKLMAAVGKLFGEDQGGKDTGGRGATGNTSLYSDMAGFKK